MGKRELLLIVAFVAIGAAVYQVTAPPLPEGQGFSVSRMWGQLSAAFRNQSYRLDARRSASVPVSDLIKVISLSGFRGDLSVLGEDRADVSAELVTDVFGADEPEARGLAGQVKIGLAVQGDTVKVTIERPPSRRRPRSDLRLRVPRRLALTLETVGRAEVHNVARVDLETRLGQLTLADIAGGIRGEHRDGDIVVTDAGALSLTTRRANVRGERITGDVAGEYTDGRMSLRDVKGKIAIECRRVETDIENPSAEVLLTSTDAGATLRNPAGTIKFTGRRSRLTLLPRKAVPLDATSEDAPVALTLPAQGGVSLDLATDSGAIEGPSGGELRAEVTSSSTGQGQKLVATVAGGGATWKVRTTRGDILLHR